MIWLPSMSSVSSVTANGLAFHVEIQGSGEPLLLLHGLTGRAESWSEIAGCLADCHETIAIDLVGHGASAIPTHSSRYDFDLALDDLAEICIKLDLTRPSWLGYSMGGRLALGLALRYPNLVTSLILESASPGIENGDDRGARRKADESLATRIEHSGIETFVDEWELLPMWHSQRLLSVATRRRQRAIRLRSSAIGLAGSLRGMGVGAQPSYWHQLDKLRCPVLLIAGSLDAKFASIAAHMSQYIPNSELDIVPNAGHAVHLEQPVPYAERVSRFLAKNARVMHGNFGGEQ